MSILSIEIEEFVKIIDKIYTRKKVTNLTKYRKRYEIERYCRAINAEKLADLENEELFKQFMGLNEKWRQFFTLMSTIVDSYMSIQHRWQVPYLFNQNMFKTFLVNDKNRVRPFLNKAIYDFSLISYQMQNNWSHIEKLLQKNKRGTNTIKEIKQTFGRY